MNKIKILIIFVFLVCFSCVYAEECDSDDISRLKKYANNVKFNYEYNYDLTDEFDNPIRNTYTVRIDNLTSELMVYDVNNNEYYGSKDFNNGAVILESVFSGNNKYEIWSFKCSTILKTENLNLKKYNAYHDYPECSNNSIDICKEFYDTSNIDSNEFYELIGENEEIVEKKKNKLLIVIVCCSFAIVASIVVIVLVNLKRKKARFK